MVARFLTKNGGKLFLGYMIVGCLPLFIFETEFNAPFRGVFPWVFLAVVLLSLVVSFAFRREFEVAAQGAKTFWIGTVLCPPLLGLMSGGYIMWYNCCVGEQIPVPGAGKIVGKDISGGREKSYLFEISDGESRKRIEVSDYVFLNYEKGETFRQPRHRGSLGIVYRRRSIEAGRKLVEEKNGMPSPTLRNHPE